MIFTPQGIVKLVGNVPLNPSNTHTIKFPDMTTQFNYFESKTIYTVNECTVLRGEKVGIKVPFNHEDLYEVNYVTYKNRDKWLYFYVVSKQYIADKTTFLELKLDVWQSYQFDVSLKACFVEREHVTDDTIGKHITDENLDTGEFKRLGQVPSGLLDNMSIVMAMSADQTLTSYYGNMYGGVYSGLSYQKFALTDIGALNDLIQQLVNTGKGDRILTIFMCPTAFLTNANESAKRYTISPTARNTTLDGYTPRNNKLFCYPYSFLYVSNNNGSSAIYQYEFMTNPLAPQFLVTGDFSPNPTVFLIPTNYKGNQYNYDEKLALGNYPQCSWTNDLYTAWTASNKNTIALGVATNVLQAVGGIATGNPLMIGGGVGGIVSQLAQAKDRQIQPIQAKGNIGGGGATLAVGIQDFHFMPTSITREYAERIDNFFDMFGYKVSTVKVPNITGRPYWNYVKTNGAFVTGDIAMEDIIEIQNTLDNGITFWHDTNNVGNYSLNNH